MTHHHPSWLLHLLQSESLLFHYACQDILDPHHQGSAVLQYLPCTTEPHSACFPQQAVQEFQVLLPPRTLTQRVLLLQTQIPGVELSVLGTRGDRRNRWNLPLQMLPSCPD